MKRLNKLFIYLIILQLPLNYIFPVSYPITPSEPEVPGATSDSGNKKKETKKIQLIEVQIKVRLGSGDQLEGIAQLPTSIRFRHYRSGLYFEKTVSPNEIEEIEIEQWGHEGQIESGKSINFEPVKMKIKLRNGLICNVEGIFPFLRKFKIETDYGETTLFTFFADTWQDKKGWSEVESTDKKYHLNKPHPQSVKKIDIVLPSQPAGGG